MSNSNIYKIKQNVDRIKSGKMSRFLDPGEVLEISNKLKKDDYKIYYPYEDCDKVIMYTDKEPIVNLLEIESYDSLKHADIMGSLFALNISPDFWGDIIINNNKYYVIVLPEIKDIIKDNLRMIGNSYVRVIDSDINLITGFRKKYEEKEIIVSSLRVDTIISRIIGINRNLIKNKIQNKEIILNYNILKNNSYVLKENDVFSIRRYGKYKFVEIVKTTKKNNYIIKYWKYI